MPDIKSNLSLMAGSRYFALLDIVNAYWNIPIQEDDRNNTGYVTFFGSFGYERIAFILSGATSSYQGAMNVMLVGSCDVEVTL
jgi:hypothetical protein